MNPIFRMAADNTELGWLLGVMTIFFVVSFAGWFWYAYNPANRERWEAAGRLPLDDDAPGGAA